MKIFTLCPNFFKKKAMSMSSSFDYLGKWTTELSIFSSGIYYPTQMLNSMILESAQGIIMQNPGTIPLMRNKIHFKI